MRRTVKTRRRVVDPSGTRRTVVSGTGEGQGVVPLDDRPIAIAQSRDRKRIIVTLPHEVWILDAKDLSRQRVIELEMPHPSVAEDAEGGLWIGGKHLHRGSSWGSAVSKVGTKLGGFVDHVVLLRPDLLCGAGHHGEVLWDVGEEAPAHRRKSPEHHVHGLVATADERAVWADGSSSAWIIDPAHPQGYTQLRFRNTSQSDVPVPGEGIVSVGVTTTGRCIVAALDGGVAWTMPDLRLAKEVFPRVEGRAAAARPLSVAGDTQWVYVLRPRGLLQRFLIAEPKPKAEPKRREESLRYRQPPPEPEPEPLPPAQSCRLERSAECMALVTNLEGAQRLIFGGSHADGHLGRLWEQTPEDLEWSDIELTQRDVIAPESDADADSDSKKTKKKKKNPAPSFIAARSKLSGTAIKDLKVDDVISGKTPFWTTHGQGTLLDRPTEVREADEILAGDSLLFPAMIRFKEGTARPALLLWPGVADAQRDPPVPIWLTWGERSSGWVPLETPQIRGQGWTRNELFPIQVALCAAPPEVVGNRSSLPKRWADREHFDALAQECKKMLKVLW